MTQISRTVSSLEFGRGVAEGSSPPPLRVLSHESYIWSGHCPISLITTERSTIERWRDREATARLDAAMPEGAFWIAHLNKPLDSFFHLSLFKLGMPFVTKRVLPTIQCVYMF